MRLGALPLVAWCCLVAGCGSNAASFDAARATSCLRRAHAFINNSPPVPGTPDAKSFIDFGFPLRPAPLNTDHGTIIVTATSGDADDWMTLMRREGAQPRRFTRNVVVVWDDNHNGHRTTRRVVQSCLREGAPT
jgi:hypothetical protein